MTHLPVLALTPWFQDFAQPRFILFEIVIIFSGRDAKTDAVESEDALSITIHSKLLKPELKQSSRHCVVSSILL